MIGIDLGSNTIRFIQYSESEKKFTKEFERVVRTAEGMNKTSNISEKALQRIIDAIEEAKKKLDFENVTAVATAAMRNASNKEEIKEKILKVTGVDFKIISADLEAKLTTLAVKEECKKFIDTPIVMTDIGGASTEIAFLGENFFYKSFDLGIVVCTEKYGHSDELNQYISTFKDEFDDFLQQIGDDNFIIASTAGTPTTLAALKHGLDYESYDKFVVSGTTLTIEEIENLRDKFIGKSKEELSKLVGVGREDLISNGVTIFIEIIKLLNRRETYVFDNSLREGIIYGKLKGLL